MREEAGLGAMVVWGLVGRGASGWVERAVAERGKARGGTGWGGGRAKGRFALPGSASLTFTPHTQGMEALEEGLRAAAGRKHQASLDLKRQAVAEAHAAAAAAAAGQDPYSSCDGSLY